MNTQEKNLFCSYIAK
uniref:Uncharacterized protein n=1 Tax=Rhizophora mucronata TaxID=61149 RepID=A0A2P2PAE6_RHIMU